MLYVKIDKTPYEVVPSVSLKIPIIIQLAFTKLQSCFLAKLIGPRLSLLSCATPKWPSRPQSHKAFLTTSVTTIYSVYVVNKAAEDLALYENLIPSGFYIV